MAKYTLNILYQELGKNKPVLFDKDGEVVLSGGKEKQDLFFIDYFIFEHLQKNKNIGFHNAKELVDYLQEYGYPSKEHVNAEITYRSEGKEKKLNVIYDKDSVLEYFALYNLYYRKQLNTQKFNEQLLQDKTFQEYQRYLLWVFEQKEFIEYLKTDGQEHVTMYTMDPIRNYQANINKPYQENKEAVRNAKYAFANIFTSYKQIRGIQLAIQEYNHLHHQSLTMFDAKDAYQSLKQQIHLEELKQLSSLLPNKIELEPTNNEELNANIGLSNKSDREAWEVLDEFYSLYDLNDYQEEELPFDGRRK